jgi:transcriptional regulator with XRE-family HTH domain
MNLGTYLRQARQARNLTTEDIATRTKIPVRLLRNLEANDFNQRRALLVIGLLCQPPQLDNTVTNTGAMNTRTMTKR